jgi:Ankyrin repeat
MGETPLMYASEEGHVEVVKILSEQKTVAIDDVDMVFGVYNGYIF